MLNGKKILICNYAGIGDLMMFTPALREIKKMYPKCFLTIVTKTANKDVLAGLPYIDKIYPIERKKILGRLKLLPWLLQQDYTVFTDWQPQLARLVYYFNRPNRSGILKKNFPIKNFYHKQITTWVLDTPGYAAEVIANALSYVLDIKFSGDMTDYDIGPPQKKDVEKVDQLLLQEGLDPNQSYFCLAPFGSYMEKSWPLEYAKLLTTEISNKIGVPTVLIGPPQEYEASKVVGAINLVGKTSFKEMVEVIRRAKLFIGPDSGPMHVAGAVNTPLIAIFSKDFPSRWAPRKSNCKVLYLDMPCVPCGDEEARSCKHRMCMLGITPEIVFTEIEKTFKKS